MNTREGALAHEALLRRELAERGSLHHLQPAPTPTVPTFEEFAERWMRDYVEVHNKPSEQRTKRTLLRMHLIPRFGAMRIDQITTPDVEQYTRARLDAGATPKSINNSLIILHRALVLAQEWGLLERVPRCRTLRVAPPVMKYLQATHADQLLAVARDSSWHLMILTALRTGLRFSELLGLQWSDIDFENGSLLVQRAIVQGIVGTPKNHRVRRIYLPSDLRQALCEQRATQGPLFLHQGRPIHHKTAYEALHRLCDVAAIPRVSWHALRHTYATQLASRGGSLHAVRELLGHASLDVTLRYAHVSSDLLRQTVALLESPGTFGQQVGNNALTNANTTPL